MSDHSLPVREAVIQALRADAGIQAIVGQRVYESVPDDILMPYIRYGVPIIRPFEATGIGGIDMDATIHAFDNSADTDRVMRLMEAIRACLQEQELTLAGGAVHYWTTWTGSALLEDGTGKTSRHGIVSFNVTTG